MKIISDHRQSTLSSISYWMVYGIHNGAFSKAQAFDTSVEAIRAADDLPVHEYYEIRRAVGDDLMNSRCIERKDLIKMNPVP